MKCYEYRSVILPNSNGRLEDFEPQMGDHIEEMNALGMEGWKEAYKHGHVLVLRRKKDSLPVDNPIEPGNVTFPQ